MTRSNFFKYFFIYYAYSNFWKKRFICLTGYIYHWGKITETMEEQRFGSLPRACSVSFLKQPRLSCLGMVSPTEDWAFLQQAVIKKMPYRRAQRPIQWRRCLRWGPLFPGVKLTSALRRRLLLVSPSHSPLSVRIIKSKASECRTWWFPLTSSCLRSRGRSITAGSKPAVLHGKALLQEQTEKQNSRPTRKTGGEHEASAPCDGQLVWWLLSLSRCCLWLMPRTSPPCGLVFLSYQLEDLSNWLLLTP